MNVNSTSSYVNSASSNKGFSGLASGMDTESMVDAMLSGTQAKIDKQNGVKQQIEWKQDIYRDIISKINAFQSQFFGPSAKNNMMSDSFFNVMNAVTASKAFRVTATSSAVAGKTTLKVDQLATSTQITSGQGVSGKLEGTLNAQKLQELAKQNLGKAEDYKVKFEVDGQTIEVDISDAFLTSKTDAERDTIIQQKLDEAFKDKGVTAEVRNGAVSLTSKDGKAIKVSEGSGKLGLDRLGLVAGTSSKAGKDGKTQSLDGKISNVPDVTFSVGLDNMNKDIKFGAHEILEMQNSGGDFTTKFKDALQQKLDAAHGKGQITVAVNGDKIELQVSAGRKVRIGGDKETLDAIGFKNGQSNRIGMNGSLKDLYFSNGLQGSSFKFTINGHKFSFDENATMNDVVNTINRSGAGVRLVYRAQSDTFTLEATESGAGRTIEMSQEEGNLLNALFGSGADGNLASGAQASSGKLATGSVSGTVAWTDSNVKMAQGMMTVTVNGTDHTFSLPKKSDGTEYTKDEAITELQKQFKDKFGNDIVLDNSNGKISIQVNNGATVSVKPSTSSVNMSDQGLVDKAIKGGDLGLALFGDKAVDNAVKGETTLKDLGISLGNGIDENTKLSELAEKTKDMKIQLSFEDGRIVAKKNDSGTKELNITGETAQKLFNIDKLELGVSSATQAKEQQGQNAIVWIDGERTERSSNTFESNGLNIELTGVSTEEETIDVTRDTDKIVEGVKTFVDEYNKLIKELNDLLDEDSSYKKYPPLTEAQKKEMSEKEIELWEKKAKQGLLRNDPTISAFLQSMRTALYEKPDGCALALYDLGIETGDWENKGQLVFTKDGEARLRQMIESDPGSVVQLFNDPEQGLAVKLNKIIDDAAKISSGSPGSLVELAGVKGKASEGSNTLNARLKELDNKIANLKRTYEKEKARYWKQFNAMEKMVAQMNSQSAWLSQQMMM